MVIMFSYSMVFTFPVFAGDFNLLNGLIGVDDASESVSDDLIRVISAAEKTANSVVGNADALVGKRIKEIEEIVGASLAEIDSIADRTAERVDSVLRKAIVDITKVEYKIYQHVLDSIREAECASMRVVGSASEGLTNTLGALGRIINSRSIEVHPIKMHPNQKRPRKKIFEIKQNDTTYWEIRKFYLDKKQIGVKT